MFCFANVYKSNYMKRFIVCLLCVVLPLFAVAQQPLTEGSYDSLRNRAATLTDRETIIIRQLEEARKIFVSGSEADKDKAGASIMELERTLFDVRGQLGEIVSDISAYEAVNGSQAVVSTESQPEAASQNKNIVENDYFRNNLSPEDYATLLEKQSQEHKVAVMLTSLKKDYDNLAILAAAYSLAEKGAQADSVYSRLEVNARKNSLLAEEIGNMWSDIFDTKIYAYNYVLDKTGERELLAGQENQMNNLYMLEEETIGEYMYDEPARYALQKLLLVGYETRIAENAGLMPAADSLKSVMPTTNHINDYFMPKLDLSERIFYDYSQIAVARPAKYSSAWQVPEVSIYPRGSMFRILLGAYGRPPQIATFKGVYPLSQEKKADGKYYYYAGGYESNEAAKAAVAKLKGMGFANPRIVAWHNGVYDDTNSKPVVTTASSRTNSKNINGIKYRIEVRGAQEGLSKAARNVISNGAAGKEVSKISASDNGEPVFVIGAFSNKTLAESMATEIKTAQPEVSLKVVQIP